MAESSKSVSKRVRVSAPHYYKDRVQIEDDYEAVFERTGNTPSHTHNGATHSARVPVVGGTWLAGGSWEPDDNDDFALDDDSTHFDAALEADVMDLGLHGVAETEEQHVVNEQGGGKNKKRKRSTVSVRPQVVWKAKHCQSYLDEILRWEGRGDFMNVLECPDCVSRKVPNPKDALFRCTTCFLPDLVCASCCSARHQLTPFHVVEKWNGLYFEDTTLADIGLRVQLNHTSLRCPNPEPAHSDLLVLHTNGIHRMNLSFCGCARSVPRHLQLLRRGLYPASQINIETCATFELLDVLHMFMLTSKLTVFDAYRSLDKLTDKTGLRLMKKSRYRALQRMTLQWRHLKMLKRGGRGHAVDGVGATRDGELALQCPTCPHPGINLPEDWMDAPAELRYLYMLIVCMDANFRLKNQLVSNYSQDPGLGTGWSYMLPRVAYEAYVLSQADDVDISTCVGFQALAQAMTKMTRGLRYPGVGGCFCGRSEMIFPNGIGNLQKGERYANMDYIFASAVRSASNLQTITVSYDIACQWFVNLATRMANRWPADLRIPDTVKLRPLIPKFHEPAHNDKGHEQYSFNLAEGVGATDGETPERVWSAHNALGTATKTQGPGSRQDVLDDNFDFWNWCKYIGMGHSLIRKHKAAVKERNLQTEAHRGFTESLPMQLVREWEQECIRWDEDGFPKSVTNPYEIKGRQFSEVSARAELAELEGDRAPTSAIPLHSKTPSAFIGIGLDLEDAQRRLRELAKEHSKTPTSLQSSALAEQRSILATKIRNWEPIRAIYMPGLLLLQSENPDLATSWDLKPNPEDIPLCLPSQLPSAHRELACKDNLPQIEDVLRTAQCRDALDTLRHTLRVKTRMVYFKNKNIRGQRAGTRSRAVIDRIHKRAQAEVSKYRAARAAKMSLIGSGKWEEELRVLLDRDVRSYTDPARKPKGRGRQGIWEDGFGPTNQTSSNHDDEDESEDLDLDDPLRTRKEGTGETRKSISWIWRNAAISLPTPQDDDGDNDDDVSGPDNDILRAEWARSRARVRRSKEEVCLLREEMRRCLAFLEYRAGWWESRSGARQGVGSALREGLNAYATSQAVIQRRLADSFLAIWKTPLQEIVEQDPDSTPDAREINDNDNDSDGDDNDDEIEGIGRMRVD